MNHLVDQGALRMGQSVQTDSGHMVQLQDVEKLATVTLMEKFVPTVSGSQKLLASMDCRQLTQVHGFTDIVLKPNDVEKLATVTLMEKFVPTVSGSQKLLASMDCRQLTQVHGFTDIVLKPK
ncbi:hypothetical protein DPX16_2666 [Anabarilius grahami]|uniref:Uncharacterized protein n=1 Tax=Anabarilius grahami TaxID=495550 RepID=A0A3N0Y4P1_ANAGA|nr:hypothetical protein DPX16_2666 [Anabarilius grahami]